MSTPPLSAKLAREALDVYARAGENTTEAARILGLPRSTLDHRLSVARTMNLDALEDPPFETPDLPDEDLPIEDILDRRRKIWKQKHKAEEARRLISIKINIDGPIALVVMGDLHIDNPGTNINLLSDHMDLIRDTEGMLCGCIGDMQDSWVGRLAVKWRDQGVTGREARKLVEWWAQSLGEKLLFVTDGNHDAWALGTNDIGPLDWISSYYGTVHEANGIRLGLQLPSGEEIRVNARHDFSGRSQFSPAFGVAKAAHFGWRDHILVAGHIHQTGYVPLKDPKTGLVSHPVRVASYKTIDDYAQERGFPDSNISECVTFIIDPYEADERHRITVDFNPFRAAKILKMMRQEWKRGRK